MSRLTQHEVIEQGVAGAGVTGDQRIAVNVSDVGNAADVHHDNWSVAIQCCNERAMIDGHQWRALPAVRHIGGAKIAHDLQFQHPSQRSTIADLNCQFRLRTMKNRLPVEADDINAAAINAVLCD